ncbi:hypothetical protein FHS31_002505 [Sphingomonas vulcanisoli]|uniref:Transporter n=1 Tax=Sphingomonas vulcanisoli TaxID=1658060 RepID=A0ABX0TTN9_9SPHN|nr:transporter [Sphingomonas vulcanisoli]NIJ08881.1 hypothetical protein [Sphingomonas vulcanisoli]
MMRLSLVCLISGLAAFPAWAGDLRDLCPDRPGLATPACTVDKGHLQAEVGLGDWTHDKQPDSITDTTAVGDISLRYGLTDSTEFRVEWTAYTHVRDKDRATGAVDRVSGIGDVTVGIKQNLMNPDGSHLSIALLPFATLPSGKDGIGAGDWGAGLLIPVNYALSDALTLELTPEVDAATDEDGSGRHLAYSGVIGLQAKLSKKLSTAIELQAIRDRDPDQHTTETLAALSFAYQPGKNSQFDIQTNFGLNQNAPDIEVTVGVTGRF